MTYTIGEKIKQLRSERGLTQEKLAERLNISAQAVSKWENGLSAPDISQLVPLAREFHVSADVLLVLSPEINNNVNEIISKTMQMSDLEKIYDALQSALVRYPYDPSLLLQSLETGISLAYPESNCYNPERVEDIYKECERQARILNTYSKNVSINDILRANMIMIMLHSAHGNYELAKDFAEKFPWRADMTSNMMDAYIAHADKNYSDEAYHCQEDIFMHIVALANALTRQGLAYENMEMYADARNSFKGVFSLIELFDPDKKYRLHMQEQGDVHEMLTRVCRKLGYDEII